MKRKRKSIIILFIIITIIKALMPMTIQATSGSELPETSDITEEREQNENNSSDIFDKDITYEYKYLQDDGGMKYALFTPSTVKENQSIPLIIWLHGLASEEYRGERFFKTVGWVSCFNNWDNMNLEGINAYILCPHTKSDYPWTNNNEREQFKKLLDNIIEEKNIDRNNIIITGASSGANGAIYMAYNMPEYFSKCVLMCGFGFQNYCTAEEYAALGIETRAYVGKHVGEDIKKYEMSASYYNTKSQFEPTFGSDHTFYLDASHSDVPKETLAKDDDGNGRSDVIEWIFEGHIIQESGSNNSSSKDKNDGGKLVVGMAQLMCFIPDSVISLFQKMFLNNEPIENEGDYTIYYSPAAIFSGTIPAFDINFVNPSEGRSGTETSTQHVSLIEALELNEAKKVDGKEYSDLTTSDTLEELKEKYQQGQSEEIDINSLGGNLKSTEAEGPYYTLVGATTSTTSANTTQDLICAWRNETKIYVIVDYGYLKETDGWPVEQHYEYMIYEVPSLEKLKEATKITDTVTEVNVETTEYESTAGVLQNTIATWYNALRRIALVGLLSVLVYIGIRIVLTSASAKDKAKYKNMLKDWLVALCILFTLHYLISITVTVVEQINEVIQASTIGSNGEDVLMTELRNDIANGEDWGQVLVQVVLYFVLAVYIIIFTIQYIRRTIYLAFLTVISPLITLTYPLDKIKDSKSQAFDMWVKDYIFFSLLQVIHLLIYYIIVGSSLDLANQNNWVFAIVAIGFLVPAEKIIKKMFGFEKSKTMGALAAGATGALVMNAINKISPKGGGKAGGTSGAKESASNNNVRTASNSALDSLKAGSVGASGASPTSGTDSTGFGYGRNILGGAKSLVGKYTAPVAKGVLGGLLGGTGAMIGLASGIAQGDISAALTGAVAGGKAGYGLGSAGVNVAANAGGNIKNSINDLQDTWRTGAYGAEYAQNQRELSNFKSSSAYKSLKGTYGDQLTDDKISAMLGAGITEQGDMEKILASSNVSDAIGYYTLAKKCPESVYYDDQKLQTYLEDLGLNQTDAKTMRDNMRKFR